MFCDLVRWTVVIGVILKTGFGKNKSAQTNQRYTLTLTYTVYSCCWDLTFRYLIAMGDLCKPLGPNSGLIWVQTVWHTGRISEKNFFKNLILKKKTADNR